MSDILNRKSPISEKELADLDKYLVLDDKIRQNNQPNDKIAASTLTREENNTSKRTKTSSIFYYKYGDQDSSNRANKEVDDKIEQQIKRLRKETEAKIFWLRFYKQSYQE